MSDKSKLEVRLCSDKHTDNYENSKIELTDLNYLSYFQGIIQNFGQRYTPADLIYYILIYVSNNRANITNGQEMYNILQKYRSALLQIK